MKFAFQSGDRPLPDYTIRRAIGRGGFGEVYYAMSDGGKEVALKYILQYHDVELRGVRQCMNLKCPNLVTTFDVRENDAGQVFVLMEYVAGPSLSQLIIDRGGALPRDEALSIFRQIATALDYLHSRGIEHRDLKPSNVFVEDGVAKIGDYGLSKFVSISEHNDHTINVGSVHYMAPEVGSGKYGTGVDIYAMGAILYQMTTGRPPFGGDTAAEILMKHLTAEPDLSPVPSGFRAVVGRALTKDPDERFQSASQMVAALTGDLKAAPQGDSGTRDAPSADEKRRSEAPTMVTPPTRRRGPSWWHRSWRHAEQDPPPAGPAAQPGLSIPARLFLAAGAAVAFELCMRAIFPRWSLQHLHRVTGFILSGALGITLANYSLRIVGVAEPLAHRIYALVLGLLFVYGYQRIWEGLGPVPIHQNQWLVFFVIVLLFANWHSRSALGRSRAVSTRLCIRAGIIGGFAGLFAGVDFWPGFYVAAAMAFLVQLLTYGPVLGLRDCTPGAHPWMRRLFWCLGAAGAGAAAVACLYWAQGEVQLTDISAPMSFCGCVWAFWFCVCKAVSRPSSDVWTGTARPALLAAALTAGGFALAAGLGGARGFRVLAFTSVAFCACLALSMKALPPMACRPARGLPTRYVLLWLGSLLLFGLFCVVPSVGLTAWMWAETSIWHVLSIWCGVALLSALVLLVHWGRPRLAAALSALTLASLLVVAFAFSHYAAHYHFGHMFGLWMPTLRGTVSIEPFLMRGLRSVPFATRQVVLMAGPLLLAALVLLWPAARDPEVESSDAGGGPQ